MSSVLTVRLHGSYVEDRGSIPGRFGVFTFFSTYLVPIIYCTLYVIRVKRVVLSTFLCLASLSHTHSSPLPLPHSHTVTLSHSHTITLSHFTKHTPSHPHSLDAFILPKECVEGFFPCHDNQQCVGGNELCDGGTDCVDGSDEDPMWCTGKADDVIDMQYTIYTYSVCHCTQHYTQPQNISDVMMM